MLQPDTAFTRRPRLRSARRAAARLVTLDVTLPGWPFVTLDTARHESAGARKGHKVEEVEDHPFLCPLGYNPHSSEIRRGHLPFTIKGASLLLGGRQSV